jgi:hypothetical protein
MLAGHYTTSFLAKAALPRAPLWALLLAAQLVDVLWVLAILTGIEHARIDPSLASVPVDLYDMPYTHSLAGTLAWAMAAALAARRLLGFSPAECAAVAAVATSHWFLDLVVHRPDLTLAGGSARLGFALWDHPVVSWALETALVAGSVALAMRACARDDRGRRAWWRLGAGLVVLQTASSFGPFPPSLTAMVLSTLAIYVVVAIAGARVDAAAS